jgi:glyoxylase-like metal-dependent hydrolase (beta-lactamase superfamily II)
MVKLYAIGALALFTVAFAAVQQRDFSQVTIKTTPVAGNVYMLEGSGGNIGVSAGPDGVLIVDDQFAPLAEKIRAAVKGINPGALRFVLNTHWHGDHTGGNAFFSKEATIIAHDNVRARLSKESTRGGQVTPAAPKEAWPVITYGQSVSLHFNGEEIRVIHFPNGHTDGDSVIFFTKSNVIHLGDDFFAGRFPFVDLNSGGSVEGLARNIGDVIALAPPDAKLIPGHGPLSTVAQLKEYHQTIVDTTDIVRAQIKAGKTLDQIKAAGLPEKYKDWGSGFINTQSWLDTVYKSLTAPQPRSMVKPPTE